MPSIFDEKSRTILPLFLINVLAVGVSYVFTLALANYLGAAEFGRFSYALVIASYISVATSFASDQLAPAWHVRHRNLAVFARGVIALRLFLLICALAVVAECQDSGADVLLLVGSLSIANLGFAFLYEVSGKNLRYAKVFLSERVAYVAVSIALLADNRLSLAGLSAVLFLVTSISLLVQGYDNRVTILQRASVNLSWFKEYLKQATPLVITSIAMLTYGGLSRLYIESKWGLAELGVFSAGWVVVTVTTMVQSQVARVFRIEFASAIVGKSTAALKKVIRDFFWFSTVPVFSLSSVIIVWPNLIFLIFANSDYVSVTNFLPIFGLYILVVNVASFVEILWLSIEGRFEFMIANVLGALTLVGCFVFSLLDSARAVAGFVAVVQFLVSMTLLAVWFYRQRAWTSRILVSSL